MTFSNLPAYLDSSYMLTSETGEFLKSSVSLIRAKFEAAELRKTGRKVLVWEYTHTGSRSRWEVAEAGDNMHIAASA